MFSMIRVFVPASVFFLMTACGGSKEATKVNGEEPAVAATKSALGAAVGAAVGVATGQGVSTGDLPDFAELPLGAKAIQNMVLNPENGIGGTLTLEASQSLAEVLKFYKDLVAKHGLKIMMETGAEDGMILSTQSADQKRSLMVTLSKGENGKTNINIVHMRRKD